jgi:hypothetical protein
MADEPPAAIRTPTVRAEAQAALVVGTSEYANENVVVECGARFNGPGA